MYTRAGCGGYQAMLSTRGRAALAVHESRLWRVPGELHDDEHRSRHPLLVMHRQGFGPRSRHQNLRCTTCNILHNTIIKLIQITTTLGKSYSLIITKRTNNEGLFNHNIIETPPPPGTKRTRCRWKLSSDVQPRAHLQTGSCSPPFFTVPVRQYCWYRTSTVS